MPAHHLPRPTAGHHYSDLLTCPQRAWLHYYGDPIDQVKDPAYLRALQQEGIEHEKAVYEHFFPNALRISEKQSQSERRRLTIEAMVVGVPVILQGYLQTEDGVGVSDALELIGKDRHSKTGHVYRVGEIKRSATLMTAHVMQAAWYTELLEKTHGQHISEACFFLRDGGRTIVDLRAFQADYEKAKAELNELRQSSVAPGPHLVIFCPSCHWRGLCMPEIVSAEHVSLIPGISRRQAVVLQEMGITSWLDIRSAQDSLLENIGLGAYEIEQVRAATQNLEQGRPPLRQPLRSDALQNLQIVVLEFPELAEQRRTGLRPTPSTIHYETGEGRTRQIDVLSSNGIFTADLTALVSERRLAFYGTTDLGAFSQIARQSGYKKIKYLDIFQVIEKFVHSPVPGLELEALYSYLMNKPVHRLKGPSRVSAIRVVVNWIAGSS